MLYGGQAERVWLYVHGRYGCKEEGSRLPVSSALRGAGRFWPLIYRSTARAAAARRASTRGTRSRSCGRYWTGHAGAGPARPWWATSLGAWFSMLAFAGQPLIKALFVSPVLDMERLICDI